MRIVSVVRVRSTVAFTRTLRVVPVCLNHMLMAPGRVAESLFTVLVPTLMRFSASAADIQHEYRNPAIKFRYILSVDVNH